MSRSRENRLSRDWWLGMTTAEYLKTPETVVPQELAYGEFRVAESPSVTHQRAVGSIFRLLASFVDAHKLGEVVLSPMDVILDFDAGVVVQPDILFLSAARSHIVADRIHGAPDLVVEVLSPSTRIGKLDEHLAWFARYGVRECWLANLPQRSVEVIGFEDRTMARRTAFFYDEAVLSEVLPGIGLKPVDVLGFY